MSGGSTEIVCSDCGAPLNIESEREGERLPCPVCGGKRRTFNAEVSERLVLRDGLGMKAKRPGQKKPYVESLSMPSQSRNLGKAVHHERLIDRDGDLYHERVTEYETGKVIHEQREALIKHVGHGSAKGHKSGGNA